MITFCRPINAAKTPGWKITTNFNAKTHPGKDYAAPDGTPLYAQQDGIVRILQANETRQWIANSPTDPFPHPRVLTNADYGNCIIIRHAEGFTTLLAHMKPGSICVKEGQAVKKGQKVGEIGSTGNSTGNHTHNELAVNGVKVDLSFYFDSVFTGYFVSSAPVLTDTEKVNKVREVLNRSDIGDGQKVLLARQIVG